MSEPVPVSLHALYAQIDGRLSEGGEARLPDVQLAHYSVLDTGLAACLLTLGIPKREPAPFTDDAHIDEHGNEKGRRFTWWVGREAPSATEGKPHRTNELMGAWWERAWFEAQYPLHPLNAMRAALDARTYWLKVINGRDALPREAGRRVEDLFSTDSLHAACILKACGFKPLAFSRPNFHFARTLNGLPAAELLTSSTQEGQTPERFMARVLLNYSRMVKLIQSQQTLIREDHGDQTLILTADATGKTKDKFFALL